MRKGIRWIWAIAGLVAVLAIALGAAVVLAQEPVDEGDTGTNDDLQTQEQRSRPGLDALRSWHQRAHDRSGPLRQFWRNEIDHDQLLADALDISVEELQQARAEARNAGLEQAVDQGNINQEEADGILAFIALSGAIERKELVAEALGISVDQLEEARLESKPLPVLIEEQGLLPSDFRSNLMEAFETAVEEAASEGEISQEQADLILSWKGPVIRRFFGPFPGQQRSRR
jgi:hypothetical protein